VVERPLNIWLERVTLIKRVPACITGLIKALDTLQDLKKVTAGPCLLLI
jgi:hypothetical protein